MKRVDMIKQIAAVALLATALTGCSTVKGWFAGKNASAKKAAEPAELVDFKPSMKVSKLWSEHVGKGEKRTGVRQTPVVADGHVYVAALEGGVRALDLQSGKELWKYVPEKEKKKAPLRLSGGPGAGEGLVVVGSLGGDVIALDAASGSKKWQARINAEIITAPAVSQGMVFVRSNDGRITALDAATGERRWFHDQELPLLTVRGNAAVVAGPGVLFVGNDDGTLSTLAMNDGRVLWQQTIGSPEGRSELDRMADVDAAPVLEGTTLFASSYKNETQAIEGPTGRPMWTRDHGGIGGVGVSSGLVIVSDRDGTVWALDKISGAPMWSQPALARRSLTGPAVQGDYVAVGDYKGYVHWMRLDNGEFAARERVGRKAILGQPVQADGLLLVQDTKGELTAFKLGQ